MTDMFALGSEHLPGLSKVTEECAELIGVAAMLMQTRGAYQHWKGDLRALLLEEIADVQNAVQFFIAYNLTPEEQRFIVARTASKREKFEEWHRGENKL